MTQPKDGHREIKDAVRKHYAGLVTTGAGGPRRCGCAPGTLPLRPEALERACCGPAGGTAYAEAIGYAKGALAGIPDGAADSSFGCGTPLAFADVRDGDVVLDLGSGAGLDVLVASGKVGPRGRVIGLDMTPEMVEKARGNARRMGAENAEFRLGEMEDLPVEDGSVDWVISNCVINLSPDKRRVFEEAHRVLRPGGTLVVSDIVAEGLPADLLADLGAWASCVSGALGEREYLRLIEQAGFATPEVPKRVEAGRYLSEMIGRDLAGSLASITVRARKPALP